MSFRFVSLLLATTALSGLPALAQQLPTGGSVAAGSVNIATPGAGQMNVTQSSSSAVVNWQTFSVGQGGRVNIMQPSSTAALLNRVTGSATSVIAGQVNANGQVYLVNPNGIAITPTGSVAAAGFVGSSLDITNEAFMSGARSFLGNCHSAAVTNAGSIAVSEGGFAALIGGEVENSGTITVPAGKVGLASGEQVTLDFTGDGFLQVAVPTQSGDQSRALVRQSGVIRARDGLVELRAATARDAVREAINMSGVIAARGISQDKGGTVILDGGEGGTTRVTGRIVTSAKSSKTMAASPKTGGKIDILGRNIALSGARLDASGSAGGGTIRIGGDKGGSGPLPNADKVSVDSRSVLRADAIQSGNGGTIIVWSNSATAFAGRLSATGGQASGNGGFAEVSSKGLLSFTGMIDLTALKGTPGTLLIDPYDVVISEDPGSDISSGDFSATSTSVINVATLQAVLANGSVQISTGASDSAGTGGTITISSALTWSGRSTNLTLTAAKGVVIGATVTDGSLGTLTLTTGDSYGLTFTNGGKIDFPTYFAATGLPSSHLTINGTTYQLVNSMDGLAALQNSSGSFALSSDLVSSQTYTSSVIATFRGRIEGLGHKISNLSITGSAQTLGLIGTATSATISNLTLDGGSITNNFTGSASNTGTGALIGSGTNNSISDVTSSVDVAGGTTKTGGLIGYANDTNISFASTSGSVTGFEMVGGLIGNFAASSQSVVITDSASSSNVVGSGRFVGGLIGYGSAGTVQHSQASGTVSGTKGVGGLIGSATTGLTLSDSHAYGEVTGTAATGGLAGVLLNATVSNSGSEGLVRQANSTTPQVVGFGGLVGSMTNGSLKDVYSLSNVEAPAAQQVGGLVGGLFGGSIDSSSASGAVVGYSRVGGLVGYQTSSGTVSNSSATGNVSGTGSIGGLIGSLVGGTVTNASASGSLIETASGSSFGGLIGVSSGGSTVTNGSSTSNVSAPNSTEVGGLVGSATNTNITGSKAAGNVTGTMNVGGLVGIYTNTGTASSYSITGSSASGDVVGITSVGGLLGFFNSQGQLLTLDNSSATGHVTGTNGVGGLIGLLDNALVTNSNATGAVQQNADGQSFGGLIGGANDGSVSNSFSTGNVSAAGSTDVGGLIGTASDITISGTHATGSVIGLTNVGGLMGSFYGVNQVPELQHSWASGDTTGNASVGGLIGVASDVTISGTYATGNVTGQLYVGGLLGSFSQGAYATSLTDSWASGTTTGGSYVGGLIGSMDQVSVSSSYATSAVQQNATGDSFGGLIGYASGGHVSFSSSTGNVSAADSTNVGGLIGYASDVTVTGTHATGSITGQSNVGGLFGSFAGQKQVPTLTNSWASGDTTGNTSVGGLIGSASDVAISVTSANGNVIGQSNVGGLLGSFSQNNYATSLANSWASGTTTGGSYVGGLIGTMNQVSVSTSYATGAVQQNATGDSFGGLIGFASSSNVSDSYSTGNVSAADSTNVGGLIGFSSDVTINGTHATGNIIGQSYVGGLLGSFGVQNLVPTLTDSWASGTTTGGSNVGGLIGSANNVRVETSNATGTVDGTSSVGGLIGSAANISMSSSYATGAVSGASEVGGLIGTLNQSDVSNSHATGAVQRNDYGQAFGGLIGFADTGSVSNSYSSGAVSAIGSSGVGGLIGIAFDLSIISTHATGNVSGSASTGGLLGSFLGLNDTPQVIDSWASGNVGGTEYVGGLIGSGNNISVARSYAVGLVTGSSSVGGLIGDFEMSQIADTYATGTVTGNTIVGGLIGTLENGNLSKSFSTGRVLQAGAGNQFGGLVGFVDSSTIQKAYSSSPVLAPNSDQVGGLVGRVGWSSIQEAYASGAVKGASNVGPVIGFADDNVTVQSTYWDEASTGLATSSFGLPLTRGVLPSDFDATVWGVVDGVSNPYFLSSFSGTPVAITGSLRTMSGTGSTDVEGLTLSATNGTSTYSNTGSSGADGQYVILADPTIRQAGWSVALSGSSGSVRLLQDVAPVTRDVALVTGAFTYASQASTYDALASEAAGVGTTLLNNFGFDVSGRAKAYFVSGDISMGNVSENSSLYLQAGGSITVNGQVAINGTATLIAGQNVLLNEDTTVQAQSPIVAALNGYFENAGGAQAIQATSGSWLVYAKDPAASSFNALWSNNVPLANMSYEAATSSGVSGNLYAFGGKLPMQATPRALSKTYGDTAVFDPTTDIVFTNPNADAYPVNPAANLTATMTSAGNSVTAQVGQYDLQLDLSSANYQFTTDVGTLNVTARPITVTANNVSRTYGDADPALTWQITSGNLVNGDSILGSLTTSAGLTSNVGGYTISAAGLAASANYALTSTDGTLSITPRSIAVTADNASRTYGDANPALTWQITSGNLVNGDSILGTLTTSAGLTSNVGGYTISAAGLAASANYALTRYDGRLTITPRSITVTADNATRTYGDANPALTWQVTSGDLVNGDGLSGTLTTSAGLTSNVGGYTISAAGLAASANYALTRKDGTLAVTARPIQIAATDVSKVIGTADPELPYSLQAGAGLVNGDSFNLRRATGETVGAYAIGLGTFAKAADYLITFTSGTFTILQGPITGASNLLTSSTSSIDSVILPSVSTITMAPAMLSINSATFLALDGENGPSGATLTTETSDTTDAFLVYQSERHAADGSCLHLNLCLTPSR